MFDAFSEPKVSKNILTFYEKIEEAKISLSDTSALMGFAKGMDITDEEFLKFIENADNADKSLASYKKQLASSTDGLSKFSAGFKSLAANLGIMLAITVAVKALSAAFDYLNVTFEEQQEIVDGLNDKISTLQSEYDELAGKGNLTEQEKNRLAMLDRQLEVQNELLKVEMKRLAAKDLEGEGDIFSNGNLADLDVNMGYGTVVGGLKREVQKNIDTLDEYRSKLNEVTDFDSWGTQSLMDMEQNAVNALEEQRTSLLEQWQKYSDSYELIKKYMDMGVWDDDISEKMKYQGLMDQYETAMTDLQKLADQIDIKLGVEIDIEPAKQSLQNAFKGKEGFSDNFVDTLSEDEIIMLSRIENVGDMTFDEVNDLINETRKNADEEITVEVDVSTSGMISTLEQLSEGFDKIDSIYADIVDKGDFDFGSLIDEDFSNMFSGIEGATEQYEKFVDVVSKSPTDIKACQSAFDDLVSAWFYGQEPLKNITDETYDLTVAWLKQQGVANAVEIADYALAQSKTAAWLAGQDLTQITAEEIEKFYEENKAAGVTKSALYQLQIQMIQTNQTGLSFEQQIGALQRLAINAGVASDAINNIFSKSPSVRRENMLMANAEGMSYNDYTLKRTSDAVSYQIQKTLKELNNSAPTISYGGGSKSNAASKSGGSKGSSSKDPYVADIDKYKDLTDAVDEVESKIKQLNQVYDHTDSLAGQIALKDKLIGLYKEEQDALTKLNEARDKEISQNVKDLRTVGFKIEYDPKTDKLQIKNREHLNSLSQKTIQKYEKLLKATEDLNDANKDSAEKWTELTYAIADVGKEITELRIKQYDEFVRDKEHLLDLLGNRKDTIGMDLSVYDDLMKGTLRTWQYLVKDGYEKNKEQIQDLEKTWMDYYDARIKREQEILEKQLDDHDRALDAVLDFIDDQLDGLDDQIDALKKINEERKEALELQKAQIALDKARNQKTRKVLRKGKGYVYEADEDAIREAEENIAEKQYEASVKQLEKQKENLEELKKVWSEIPDLFEKYQNELLASQILGKNWEQKILDGREDAYRDFKDAYFDLQEEIQNKSDELENHMNQSYINMVEIFRKMATLYGNMNNISSGRSWYVNKDGKAPSQAQKGDIIYTKGGTYQITGKDENGKFTSQKINNNANIIPEGMWGKEIEKANSGLTYALGENVLSNQAIVDASNAQIEQIKHSMLASGVLNTTILEGKEVTEEEIRALIEQTEYVGTNSLSIKGNTVQMGTLTTSIGALTNAINNTGSSIGGNGSGNITDFIEGIPVRGNTPAEQKVNYWSDVLAELKAQGASQSEIDYVEGQLEKALKKLQSSSNTPQMFANSLSETNVSAMNKQIDTMYEGITGMEAVGKYLANNTYFTQEEINTLAKHMGITDINTYAMNENADSTDANTDSQNENTDSLNNATDAIDNLSVAVTNMAYAQAEADAYNTANNMKEGVSNEKWLKYWDDVLNFSDRTGLLTQEEVNNALAQRNRYQELVNQEKAIQDMVNGVTSSTLKVDLSEEDKRIIKTLQDAYNTAKAAGNEEGMELAHQLAEAVRNGFDISPSITTKSDYQLSDTTYTGGASASTGNKSNLQKDYEWQLSKAKEFGASKDYISRLENAIARETYGSGSKIDTYTDEYGRTSTIINAADKSELNMSADDLKNRYDAGWRPVNDGMDKLGGNLKETNDTLSDNSDAMYDSSDKIDGSADKIVDSSNNVVGKLDSLENAISNANFGGGYSNGETSSGGSSGSNRKGGSSDPTKGMSAEDKARYNNLKTTAAIAERNGNTAIKNAAKSQMADIKDKYTKKKAKGGRNLVDDIYNVDEYGKKELIIQPTTGRLVHLSYGSDVIPADVTKNLWDFGENPTQYMESMIKKINYKLNTGGGVVNNYHIQELSLPNVVDGKEFWENMTQNLPNEAAQWSSTRR